MKIDELYVIDKIWCVVDLINDIKKSLTTSEEKLQELMHELLIEFKKEDNNEN